MKLDINLEELRVQVALGTIPKELCEQIWLLDDKEALIILSNCSDVEIRKAVAINQKAPYSVLKKMYTSESDHIIRDCAWEQIARRYKRRFKQEPPLPPWRDPWANSPDDLPDDTLVYYS